MDDLWERCPWQIDITIPKRIRDIFPPKAVPRVRSPHRTRSSIALHNGAPLLRQEPEKTSPTSDFSQEELDLEMVVVCAGEFVKEVFLPLSSFFVPWSLF